MSTPAQLPKSVVYKHGRYYFIAAAGDTRKIKWHPLGRTWSEAGLSNMAKTLETE